MGDYATGYGFPQSVLFDQTRMQRLFSQEWFFAGTRGDVPMPRDFLKFQLMDDEYLLIHGTDGVIRCFANRCAHQSARLMNRATGKCAASLICPNHQWAYNINDGSLRNAPGFGADYPASADGRQHHLIEIRVVEVAGLLFACLAEADRTGLAQIEQIIAPYVAPYGLGQGGYKLAHHRVEVIDANWLLVMINNRECCHCSMNHKNLTRLFDPSSFNGSHSASYDALMARARDRWDGLGLAHAEQAFAPNDSCRVARYPLKEGYRSITFDGAPASRKLIGPFAAHESSTLSMWFNPNAWIHFACDHIATNWVMPNGPERTAVMSSWIVRADAVEGEDYDVAHLTDVWRVTNAEDVGLCESMTAGARSAHYRPGPFAPDERFCVQFCDWYMAHSAEAGTAELRVVGG